MPPTTPTDGPQAPEISSDDYRWNAWAFILDSGFFFIAVTFISSTTVLPAFVAALSNSEVMVGLASGLISGGWLLPQLFVASAVAHLPRKKPTVVWAALLSRPVILVMALLVWLFGAERPGVVLAATMLGIFVFFLFDAVVSVPWFDLLAKCLPARRRGRVVGASQVVGALGGIGAGAIVRWVLAPSSPLPFPSNYALLFAIGGVLFMVSAAFLVAIREPVSTALAQTLPPSPRQVLASMPGILARDRAFRLLIVIKLLHSFVSVASAFYVLHATRNLGLGLESAGLFVSAQVVGSLVGGLLTGLVQDRWGPWVHIRLMIVVTSMSPVLALLTQLFMAQLGSAFLYSYLVLFLFLGIANSSMGWPFFNWILEHAKEADRPVYIGMSNTLSAIVMLAPALGGWVAKSVSYPATFGLALAFGIVAWALTPRLPNTRRGAAAQ